MENASKALLMAGGILIALLVIGALTLMFNQLSDYQKFNSNIEKQSQLDEYNKQFTQYSYTNVKGYEVLTLINKVIDNNKKDGIINTIDYNKKITIKITGLYKFNEKYAYSTEGKNYQLFPVDQDTVITITNESQDSISKKLVETLNECTKAENGIDIDELKKLSGLYNKGLSKKENIAKIKEELDLLFPRWRIRKLEWK